MMVHCPPRHTRILALLLVVGLLFLCVPSAFGFANSTTFKHYMPFDIDPDSNISSEAGTVAGARLNTSSSVNGAGSYSFDGSNDKIQYSNGLVNSLAEMTACAWARPRDFSSTGTIFSMDTNTHAWINKQTSGLYIYRMYINSVEVTCTGNRTYTADGEYKLMCISFSDSGNRVRGWGSGALECESATAGTAITGNQFQLGVMGGSAASDWEGNLDEIMVWHEELTPQNMSDLWNEGAGFFYPWFTPPPPTNNLTFFYPSSIGNVTEFNGTIGFNTSLNSTECWINNSLWVYDNSSGFSHAFDNVSNVINGFYNVSVTCLDTGGINTSGTHAFIIDVHPTGILSVFSSTSCSVTTTASVLLMMLFFLVGVFFLVIGLVLDIPIISAISCIGLLVFCFYLAPCYSSLALIFAACFGLLGLLVLVRGLR